MRAGGLPAINRSSSRLVRLDHVLDALGGKEALLNSRRREAASGI
jgi:hypothetical protein